MEMYNYTGFKSNPFQEQNSIIKYIDVKKLNRTYSVSIDTCLKGFKYWTWVTSQPETDMSVKTSPIFNLLDLRKE